MAAITSGAVYHITNAKATANAIDLSGTDQRHSTLFFCLSYYHFVERRFSYSYRLA